jgi:peroxiredoxin Q/BCP
MPELKPGDVAPALNATDQSGRTIALSAYAGRKVLLFFYPKANTSGCTAQAQSVRDALPELAARNVVALGVSPDTPELQKKFDDKHALGFPLLSDPEHHVAESYGVWGEKSLYGRKFMGIIRSAFLIDEKGRVERAWYKISPKNTIPELNKALKK